MLHKYCRVCTVISALLLCLTVFPAIAADDSYVIVEAEGIGTDRASAMDSAWLEGIRKAAGSFIDAKTELNNDQLTERIISYSRGLVEKYEVLSVDYSQAGAGIYKMKLRMWIVRDILRDGAKHATAGSSEVSFSASDLKRKQKEELDAKALEARNAQAETAKRKAQTAPELLSAMLERYKPEDFLSCYIPGKPEAVKDKQDTFRITVEISFNEKLYHEAFVPDLLQVLDQIAKGKKNVTLMKQRENLRNLAGKKALPLADTSIICREAGLDNEYKLAVYDRPNRFGCRLYSFSQEDEEKILGAHGIFDQFCGRTNRISGIILELLDDNKEIIDTVQADVILPFLVSNNILSYKHWAVHPSILKYEAMFCFLPLYTERLTVNVPLTFELPKEFLEEVKSVKASIRINDEFAKSGIETRIALNNSVYGYFKNEPKKQENFFRLEADKGYPLAKIAMESINIDDVSGNDRLILDEKIDRLTPAINNGNIDASYRLARILEGNPNYEIQKRCVQYYIKAAEKNPAAMIRLGEVYEQGFYDVPVDKKKADALYAEGLRLLYMLASHDHPNAAGALGRAALEGLGMKHNAPLAETCYKFAKDSGYYDSEFWLWENFGIAMRRVSMTNDIKAHFTSAVGREVDSGVLNRVVPDASTNPRTCMYLVRQKVPVIQVDLSEGSYFYTNIGAVNRTTQGLSQQIANEDTTRLRGVGFIGVKNKEAKTTSDYWGRFYFEFIDPKDKK